MGGGSNEVDLPDILDGPAYWCVRSGLPVRGRYCPEWVEEAMSWKGSLHYWHLGPLDFHIFIHVLDDKQRRFYEIGWGKHSYQIWPPRSVLDWRTEWTR